MKKSKLILIVGILIVCVAIFKTYSSIPKELEKITSPDGKITATISEKSGNLVVETNTPAPLTICYENSIDYGMSAFSADSRFLFVAIEKEGRGDIECRDFVENKSFTIHLQNIIRNSSDFKSIADDYGIEEVRDAIVNVIDINEHSFANLQFVFNDQSEKKHSLMVSVDLYNQKVEFVK